MNKDAEIAMALIEGLDVGLTDVARLFLELVERSGAKRLKKENLLNRCRKVIEMGVDAVKKESQTVPFSQAVEELIEAKKDKAKVTQRDMRYVLRKIMNKNPEWRQKGLRSISTQDCTEMLERTFPLPSQRKKARAILSGVFSFGRKRQWCGENPVSLVDIPKVIEEEVVPLKMNEIQRLIKTAQSREFSDCTPAIAIMLWAGVRPTEVSRLKWGDVDFEERELIIAPRHSKTGGGRHIPIYPVLWQVLHQYKGVNKKEKICPVNWFTKWRLLRLKAGFRYWQKDVLRHTFASYFAKKFRDLQSLQHIMGHRSTSLLRTRYVNLKGISHSEASMFWKTAV